MAKAFGYARCSTSGQVESGLGMSAQRNAIEGAAKRLGLDLAAVFADEGLSGGLPLAERPGLLDAVASLKRGDTLLVAKRDRLGRDVVNVALIEREVTRRGARIVSAAGEGSEIEGPTGPLIRTILDAVAQHEKAVIALRTRLALSALRAEGYRAGCVPYGYRALEDGRLESEPGEQAAIALVRALRADGLKLREIVAALGERGVLGRTGKPLGQTQVARIAKAVA